METQDKKRPGRPPGPKKKKVAFKRLSSTPFTPFVKLEGIEWGKSIRKGPIEKDVPDVNGRAGEFRENRGLYHYISDTKEYIKVYTEGMVDIEKLSKPALRLFMYICRTIESGQEVITLHPPTLHTTLSFGSLKQVYQGIVDLVEADVIAKKSLSEISEYFINPNKLFSGDRRRLFSSPGREEEKQALLSAMPPGLPEEVMDAITRCLEPKIRKERKDKGGKHEKKVKIKPNPDWENLEVNTQATEE